MTGVAHGSWVVLQNLREVEFDHLPEVLLHISAKVHFSDLVHFLSFIFPDMQEMTVD